MLVGRLLSDWEGNFSGAMINFGGVTDSFLQNLVCLDPYFCTNECLLDRITLFLMTSVTLEATYHSDSPFKTGIWKIPANNGSQNRCWMLFNLLVFSLSTQSLSGFLQKLWNLEFNRVFAARNVNKLHNNGWPWHQKRTRKNQWPGRFRSKLLGNVSNCVYFWLRIGLLLLLLLLLLFFVVLSRCACDCFQMGWSLILFDIFWNTLKLSKSLKALSLALCFFKVSVLSIIQYETTWIFHSMWRREKSLSRRRKNWRVWWIVDWFVVVF